MGVLELGSTLSVLVTGIWNNSVKLGTPIVALAILAVQGEDGGGRVVAALVGIAGLVAAVVIFALVLRSEDFARRGGPDGAGRGHAVGRLLRRGPASGLGPCHGHAPVPGSQGSSATGGWRSRS